MTVRLKSPPGSGTFGWGGMSFAPDARGIVTIPDAAVDAAIEHGYKAVPEEDDVAAAAAASQPTGDAASMMDRNSLVAVLKAAKVKFFAGSSLEQLQEKFRVLMGKGAGADDGAADTTNDDRA